VLADLQSILLGLLTNIVWLPIGALLVALGYFIQVRLPRRKLWRLSKPSDLVVCAATSTVTDTGEYHRPATGIGQVRALAVAVNSLSKAYSRQLDLDNILFSIEPLQERIEHDLLLLGGPKNNEATAHFLNAMKDVQPALQFANPDRIVWREKTNKGRWVNNGAVEFTAKVARKQVVIDYGLIMRVQNPFTTTRDTSVILLSGGHTYGLVAAAKFFAENMKKMAKHVKQRNLVAVVSTHVIDGHPARIKLEKIYSW
jgi:hypothetical protein